MDMLVMGNGFDLEHKIPSSYKNFLEFITAFNEFYKLKNLATHYGSPNKIRFSERLSKISNMYKDVVSLIYSGDANEIAVLQEFFDVTENNQWINYFQTCLTRRSEYGDTYNWVDIEEEIADVIKAFTDYEKNFGYMPFFRTEIDHTPTADGTSNVNFGNNLINSVFDRIKNYDENKIQGMKGTKTYRDLQKDWILFSQKLHEDFNQAIRALEIYLGVFVDFDKVKPSPSFENVKSDRFMTFNYTDTYRIIYKKDKHDRDINGDFVHGKVDLERPTAQNNMVVGIEEFLSDEEKNKNVEFVDYRKYYQRIVKRCDFSYHKWLKNEDNISTWFVGHSMATTDRDILSKLLPMPENNISKAYICYHSDNAFRQEVVNLAQILGQDYLSEMTCGAKPNIVFLNQTEIRKYMQGKKVYDATRKMLESYSSDRR